MTEENKQVLLIDDDELLRGMYVRKFVERGFTVETADSATSALEKLKTGLSPALILFDIVLPGLNGFEFLEALAKEKLGEGAKKVALSNQTSEEDMTRATSLGAHAFITKATSMPSEIVDQVLSMMGYAPQASAPTSEATPQPETSPESSTLSQNDNPSPSQAQS